MKLLQQFLFKRQQHQIPIIQKPTQSKKQQKKKNKFFYYQQPKKKTDNQDDDDQENNNQNEKKKLFIREQLQCYKIITQYYLNDPIYTRFVSKIYKNNWNQLSIATKDQRLLCAKLFNNFCRNQKSNSKFVIDMFNGNISLINSTLNIQHEELSRNKIQEQVQKMHEKIKEIAPRLFQFNNQYIKRDIIQKKQNYKFINVGQLIDQQTKIESYIIASGTNYKFMNNIDYKFCKNTEINESLDNLYRHGIKNNPNDQKILKTYFPKLKLSSIENIQKLIDEEQNTLKRYLIPPVAKIVINSSEKTNLYSKIKILQEEKLKFQKKSIIHESDTSVIYRFRIQYLLQNDQNLENAKAKLLIAKDKKASNQNNKQSKSTKQIDIYKTIKDQTCVHITRAYYSTSNFTKKYFWADYYMYGSISDYSRHMNKTLSILTKIYLLYHAVQGLRFLHQNKIVHRDKLNQNKLIGKGVILRLNNFRQSESEKLTDLKNKNIHLEDDIQDFGNLILKFILNKSPIQKNQKNESTTTIINPEYFRSEFVLNELITLIYYKCVYEKNDNKPKLLWLIILLRQLLNLLQQMY